MIMSEPSSTGTSSVTHVFLAQISSRGAESGWSFAGNHAYLGHRPVIAGRRKGQRMKKILLGIVAVLGLAIVVILGLAATQPDSFEVSRSTVISAPPAVVYSFVEDLHRHGAWSPWDKLDPNMKRTFSGAEHGEGSVYEWSGNDDVGAGRMTIVATRPNEQVDVRLEFLKPFEATNATSWHIAPASDGSKVVWSMSGPNNFVSKIMCVFADMDKMIGKDFEKGLDSLKHVSERAAASGA